MYLRRRAPKLCWNCDAGRNWKEGRRIHGLCVLVATECETVTHISPTLIRLLNWGSSRYDCAVCSGMACLARVVGPCTLQLAVTEASRSYLHHHHRIGSRRPKTNEGIVVSYTQQARSISFSLYLLSTNSSLSPSCQEQKQTSISGGRASSPSRARSRS